MEGNNSGTVIIIYTCLAAIVVYYYRCILHVVVPRVIIAIIIIIMRLSRVSVRSFLPPRASRPRNILILAENASFTCKLRGHLLASMPLTTPKPQKYGYQRNPRNVGMTYYSRF